MKKTHYKSITITVGLICLMIVAILLIALATKLFKGNAAYAKTVGIFLIISLACLSLNPATTILDRPKDSVPNKYRKLVLGIIIATGVVVLLWLIVLFATDPGLIIRYSVGKRFKVGTGEGEFADKAAAYAAATAAIDKVRRHLIITQLSVCLTVIVAYFNLVVTRRYILKNRMIPIQVALYVGAFLFYIWFFIFAASAHAFVFDIDKYDNYARAIVEPTGSMGIVVNPVGFTLMLSGLAIYIISIFSSMWAVRRFKNEGLYEERSSTADNKVQTSTTEKADNNDIKARLEKLNELHSQGLISDEEFENKKKEIIDSL